MEKISENTANFIKAQQYIHNTYLIVKELVENSIDANSSIIKVIVDETSVIVEDNGDGIENLLELCKFGSTSKELNSYKVLGLDYSNKLFEHGFRGQALASIREQCDMEIISKPKGFQLGKSYNYSTQILKDLPREIGTTVKVINLFKNSPIRRDINKKDLKNSIVKTLHLFKSFCYVYDVNISLIFKGKTLFCSQGSSDTKSYAMKLHKPPILEIDDLQFSFFLFPFDKSKSQVTLFHKRLCRYDKILEIVTKIFKMFFDYPPTYILVLKGDGDINLAADKADIILKNNKYIENKLKSELDKYFASNQLVEGFNKSFQYPKINKIESVSSTVINDINDIKELPFNLKIPLPNPKIPYEQSSSFTNLNESHDPTVNLSLNPKTHSIGIKSTKKNLNDTDLDMNLENKKFKFNGRAYAELISGQENIIKSNDRMPSRSVYFYIKEEILQHENILIDKSDFKKMEVIGQFNKGFILCTLKKGKNKLLIAIDQHAAHEIYNFELLKRTFVLKKQRLLKPIDLNFNPIQEMMAMENLSILENNGFEVEQGRLLTIPVYSNTFFTVEDFFSLLENITEGNNYSNKYKNLMASKACRKSIMIGDTLGYKEMKTLVNNLSSLDMPWNCPHGRPTYKILSEL